MVLNEAKTSIAGFLVGLTVQILSWTHPGKILSDLVNINESLNINSVYLQVSIFFVINLLLIRIIFRRESFSVSWLIFYGKDKSWIIFSADSNTSWFPRIHVLCQHINFTFCRCQIQVIWDLRNLHVFVPLHWIPHISFYSSKIAVAR